MEPNILMIGREKAVIDKLANRLRTQGRNILSTDSSQNIRLLVMREIIDLVVMDNSLTDPVREAISHEIHAIRQDLPIYLKDKNGGQTAFIDFVHHVVEEYKASVHM